MDSIYLVLIGGFIISTASTAYFWDKYRYLKFLPILYGLCCGLILSVCVWREQDIWKAMQTVLSFGFVGVGLLFSVWIQLRRK